LTVKIDQVELVLINDDSTQRLEIRSVNKLEVINNRKIARNYISSAPTNITVDEGRESTQIHVKGSMTGNAAKQTITMLKDVFKKAQPIEFSSDLSLLFGISKVTIKEISITLLANIQNSFSYELVLLEDQEK